MLASLKARIVFPNPEALWVMLVLPQGDEAFQQMCALLDSWCSGWGIPIPLYNWGRALEHLVVQIPGSAGDSDAYCPLFDAQVHYQRRLIRWSRLGRADIAWLMRHEQEVTWWLPLHGISGDALGTLSELDGVTTQRLALGADQGTQRGWELRAGLDRAGRAPCIADIPHVQGTVSTLLRERLGWSQERINTVFYPSGHLYQVVFPTPDRVFLYAQCLCVDDSRLVQVR
jgi:hypothetical protein